MADSVVSTIRLFAAIVMVKLQSPLTTVTLVSLLALAQCSGVLAQSHLMRKDELHALQLEAAKRYTVDNFIKAQQDDASTSTSGIKNITFSNPLASRESKLHSIVCYSASDYNVQNSTWMVARFR